MARNKFSLGETELAVLQALWSAGPLTAGGANELLREQGRRWAYTTVLTFLHRLEAKGLVKSNKSTVPHVFRAAVSRDMLLRQRLRSLADELCEGTSTPLVHALVAGQRFTAEEIEQFRRLLDEATPRGGRSKKPG